jgi:hypothetical protein
MVGVMMINWDVFIDKYEAEQKQINEDSESFDKFIENGCDQFLCKFVGSKHCIASSCKRCKLSNCRGCKHLKECIEELMEN